MKRMFSLTAIAVVFTVFISSCEKKGCTDPSAYNYSSGATKDDGSCLDFTATVTGNYTGTILDSIIGSPSVTYTNQQISVTKVDDQHVVVAGINGGTITPFTGKLSAYNGSYLLYISSQNYGSGGTLTGTTFSGSGTTANGAYQSSNNQFSSATTYTSNGEVFLEFFIGTKQ